MTPTAKVVQILNSSQITGVDSKNVHAFLIPSFDWDEKPIIQVNEIQSLPSEFGNNDFTSESQKIQIQIYYPKDYSEDMSTTEDSIKAVMNENGYRIYDLGDHIMTPDGNFLITLKFNYIKEIF
ncbi:DUF806 family protein [Pediococcus claussenii]|uniref:DUF806 family protein n=1 Tax=Pediococcus claussenii TaxID=187452 RepID=UPI00081A4E65|nr:DUF806 family protein [Pediococcus claussenii]ANZ70373.1 hypothetical protein AYR57_08615 [Pediococcus claussenii]ANZ72189.1 hypothetical protein AYR58_08615 [Pediococcus claussenii]